MKKFIFITLFIFLGGLLCAFAEESCEIIYGMRSEPYKPYEWRDDAGRPQGMNIDLLKELSIQMGCTYKIVSGSREELLDMLENGGITMLSMSPTPTTDRFGVYVQQSIVLYRYVLNRLDDPYIDGIEDWHGKMVLMIEGSYSQSYLDTIRDEYDLSFIVFDSHEAMVQALEDGIGDFFIASMPTIMNLPDHDIKINGYPLLPSIYGFVLNKENSLMYTKLNMAMEKLKESGDYFDIMQKWSRPHETPEWYKYILPSIAALIIAVTLILLWNKSLHVRVQHKTASLNSVTQLLKMLLDALPEQIALINRRGEPVWSNTAVSPEASFSITLIKNEIEQAIATGHPFNIKRLLNNSETWMISGIILSKEAENTDAIENPLLLIASNITESVRQREEALTADRMAALGNMAANIAHEINNPMGLIMHNMNFLRQLSADLYTFVDTNCMQDQNSAIRFAGFKWNDAKAEGLSAQNIISENMLRVINTVADLKKFSKKRDDVYKAVDLKECINNAVRFISYFVRHYTADFTYNAQNNIPAINAHEQHIEQVVINLIQNACYALTDRSQAISCTLALSDDGKYAVITVADKGRGMDDATKKQAFDAFFTTRENGTGLGLSIVASIIKEHRGYYTIESETGKGTAISVFLPVTDESSLPSMDYRPLNDPENV